LAASIHSYNHAIRLLSENGDSIRASGLCIELADALIKLEKPGEAITFYQRAADFRPSSSLSYLHARENVARTFIRTGDHHNALTIFTEIANIVEQIGGKPYTSVYLDILGRCELFRVLLLLLIQPAPQNVSPNLTNILEKYAWESSGQVVRESGARSDQHSQESSAGTLGNQYLSEEVFLLLQSIVMAVQVLLLLLKNYLGHTK
jgi:tetratricopeptide (TPR) repeat protein